MGSVFRSDERALSAFPSLEPFRIDEEFHDRTLHRAIEFAAAGRSAALISYAGCSGSGDDLPREAVAGTVTLDGQPLAERYDHICSAATSAGVEGIGEAETRSRTASFRSRAMSGWFPAATTLPSTRRTSLQSGPSRDRSVAASRAELAKELIPAKYNSKTELTAEIKKGGGNDQLKFDLQSK